MCCISETWLHLDVLDRTMIFPVYKVLRRDRVRQPGSFRCIIPIRVSFLLLLSLLCCASTYCKKKIFTGKGVITFIYTQYKPIQVNLRHHN